MHKLTLFIISFWLLGVIFSYVLNFDPNLMQLDNILSQPNLNAFFGRDDYGRSILIRLIEGFKNSAEIIFTVSIISCSFGVLVGTVSGFFGGKFDQGISFVINLFMSFPGILLAIAFAAVLGPGKGNLIIALSIGSWVGYARISRGQTLLVKNYDFVNASRSMGASDSQIILKHIIPSISTPLAVEATYAFAGLIIAEASLSFLGLGLQAPEASWGSMMRDSVRYLLVSPHYAILVGMSIMSVVYCINYVGDYFYKIWGISNNQGGLS